MKVIGYEAKFKGLFFIYLQRVDSFLFSELSRDLITHILSHLTGKQF